MHEMHIGRVDGSYDKLVGNVLRTDVLVLDNLGLNPMSADGRRDLLELLDDRHARASTIVTSQLPVKS